MSIKITDLMITITDFRDSLIATLYKPMCDIKSLRINQQSYDPKTIDTILGEPTASSRFRIKKINPTPKFANLNYANTNTSLSEAIDFLGAEAYEQDAPLHAIDVYRTIFGFGTRGYTIVGESAFPDGSILPDAIRMEIERLPPNHPRTQRFPLTNGRTSF